MDRADPVLGADKAQSVVKPAAEKLESFRREIEIMGKLGNNHPHVVKILGVTADFQILVLERGLIDLHYMIRKHRHKISLTRICRSASRATRLAS